MDKQSSRPHLNRLRRRQPYANHWGQRCLSLPKTSHLGLRSFAVAAYPSAPMGILMFGFFAIISSHWSWGLTLSIPMFLIAVWCARATAYSRVSGPLQADQVEHLQKWLASSPDLNRAASAWARPEEKWRQRDYWLVRNAYVEEYKLAHGQDPVLDTPDVLGVIPWYLTYLSPGPLASSSSTHDVRDWLPSGRLLLSQARRSPQADPAGYTPSEFKRLTSCVHRYQKARSKLTQDIDLNQLVEALRRRDKQGFFSEGTSWAASIIGPPAATAARFISVIGSFLAIWTIGLTVISPLGDPTPAWNAIYVVHLLSVVGFFLLKNLGWICLAVGSAAFAFAFRSVLPRLTMARTWDGAPLSPVGQDYLKGLLHSSPRLAAWFLPAADSDLRQIDLRFARRLAHLLAPVEGREEEAEDQRLGLIGAQELPATQAYIARQRAEEMDSVLPCAAPPAPRSRL